MGRSMYNNTPVIDVHGHISTPPHFRAHAYNLLALRTPGEGEVQIPETAMKQALDRHLRMMDMRNIDIQLISPRPVGMMHWERSFIVEPWTRKTNDVIHQQCQLHPKRFAGVGQLPQTPDLNIQACVKELTHCIKELGFVGAILNPDPGGDRRAPGLHSEEWYPLYDKAEDLNATLVVHPSLTHDRRLEIIPHAYQYNNMTEETLATMLLERGRVFERFPRLRIVVCHCGGGLRRILDVGDVFDATRSANDPDNICQPSGERAGGQVGAGNREVEARADLSANLFFDTCAYDPWFLTAAIHLRGTKQMVFGTEAPGAGSAALNPQTGKPVDDVLATLNTFDFLSEAEKTSILHHNPRRVFPLLEKLGLF
jgi:predicted TIM-barrel fold metal-dependent hydrolase